MVLIANLPKGRNSKTLAKLRHSGCSGIYTIGWAKTSVDAFKDEETIQMVGTKKVITQMVITICSITNPVVSIILRRLRDSFWVVVD